MSWKNAVSRVIPPWRAVGLQRSRGLAPSSLSNLTHWYQADSDAFVDAAASFSGIATSNLVSTSSDFQVNAMAAAYFNNNTANRLTNTSAGWQFADVDMYICCWVYFQSLAAVESIYFRGTDITVAAANSYYLRFTTASSRLRWSVSNGTTRTDVDDTTVLATGRWYFVECVHNAATDTIGIAVDGAAFTTAAHTGGVLPLAGTTNMVGVRDTVITAPHFGYIQGLGIFGAIPSAGDRAVLYNSGAGVRYSDLSASFKTTNLLSVWHDMSETSGNRADQHGGVTLTQTGTVSSANGHIAHEDVTICGWFYLNALGAAKILIGKSDTASAAVQAYRVFASAANNLSAAISDSIVVTTITDGGPLVTGTWYFFAFVYDASTQTGKLSLNNGAFSTATIAMINQSAVNLALGRDSATVGVNYHNGRLDSISFWKRELTAAEITYLYNGAAGRIYDELGAAGTDGANLKTSLTSWWNLDEHAAGSNRIDAHSTNHLTDASTAVTSNAGIVSSEAGRATRYGNATRFDATRYLELVAAGLDTATTDMTVCMWVNLSSLAATTNILGRWNPTGNLRQWLLQYDQPSNRFTLIISSLGTAASNTTFTYAGVIPVVGTWFFLVFRHARTTQVQLNVNQTGWENTAYASAFTSFATAPFRINGTSGGGLGSYRAAFCGLWNRLLTDSEVAAIYNSPFGRAYTDLSGTGGLISYWDLDEEVGNSLDSHGVNDLVPTGGRLSGQGLQVVYSDAVSLWDDQANTANVTKSSFAARPYWQERSGPNERPTLVFDGSDDSLSAGVSQSLTAAFTVAWVGRQAISSTNDPIIGETNNNISLISNTSLEVRASGVAVTFTISSVGDVYRSIIVTRDGSNNVSVFVNGVLAAASQVLAGTLSFTHVGSDGTNYYLGDLSELVVYSKALTATEISGLHTYFKQKYGL